MDFEKFLIKRQKNLISDFSEIISIDTSLKNDLKSIKSPLGSNITRAFEVIEKICIRENLIYKNYNNKVFEISIGTGTDEEAFMFLNHIDVVPIYNLKDWKTNPFELVEDQGFYYGRGVNDNKGPLIYILYFLIYLKDYKKLNFKIKLLIGGAEETTWEGVKYYFDELKKVQPKYGISPDGNFPIINCEKGIIYFKYEVEVIDEFIKEISSKKDRTHNLNELEITFRDDSVKKYNTKILKSRSPLYEFSLIKEFNKFSFDSNIKDILLNNFNDVDGSSFNLKQYEDEERKSTMNVSSINYDGKILEINFDFRYIDGLNLDSVIKVITGKLIKSNKCKLSVDHKLELLSVRRDSELVINMKKAYEKITNKEATVHCKGAASYARVLDNGLSFGPVFANEKSFSHEANERQSIDGLLKAIKIYQDLLIRLGGINEG